MISAIQGLGDIGPPAVAAVPAMLAVFKKAMEFRHSVAQTVIPTALARIAAHSPAAPDDDAASTRLLDTDDGIYQVSTIEALGHFGKEASAAIPRLRELLQDPRTVNRNAIAKSLTAIEAQSQPNSSGE